MTCIHVHTVQKGINFQFSSIIKKIKESSSSITTINFFQYFLEYFQLHPKTVIFNFFLGCYALTNQNQHIWQMRLHVVLINALNAMPPKVVREKELYSYLMLEIVKETRLYLPQMSQSLLKKK